VKVVVLWSGGVESTSLLLWALQQPDTEVHAHFVELQNQERRHLCERRAVNRLRRLLPANLVVTRSAITIMEGQATAIDAEVLYPIGRVVARHVGAERVLRGWCAEDEWHRGSGAPPMKWRGPCTRFETIARRVLGDEAETLTPWLPELYTKAKAWHWANLGELAQHTWSCRRPVNDEPCGLCHACTERVLAAKGQSALVFPALPPTSPHAR
jgi:7-cyano-7-deazaguanine synthase in queuosine biosynthesis